MKTRKLSQTSHLETRRPRLAKGKQKSHERQEQAEGSAPPTPAALAGRPPSASSSRVTPSRSAISKACSRFSRLLWICTRSMSTRSGLQNARQSPDAQGRAPHTGTAAPRGSRRVPAPAGGSPRGAGLQHPQPTPTGKQSGVAGDGSAASSYQRMLSHGEHCHAPSSGLKAFSLQPH